MALRRPKHSAAPLDRMIVKHITCRTRIFRQKDRAVPRKPTDPAPTVASIIRDARGDNTQETFAAEIGITQDRLSKYENGKTNPPAAVIERCLKIVHDRRLTEPPNAHAIARQVEATLDGSENAELRRALALLLNHLTGPRPGRRLPLTR